MKKVKKFKKKFKKIFSNLKRETKNLKDKLINVWKKDPKDILIPTISFVLCIIISIITTIFLGIILFIIINCIYFIPIYIKKKDKEENMKNNGKNIKSKKKKKTKLKIALIILLGLFIFGIILAIVFFVYIALTAPKFSEELLYVSNPTTILDKDGNEIAKLGSEKRVKLDYDEVSEVLIDAIVATEDANFFNHNGVDWPRFLKASFLQALGQSSAGGASTLTMQVSKNTATSTESSGIKGIIRKFTDIYVSIFEIEKDYTKEQIFAFYINSQYLGRSAYGVEQVSLNYFGKSANELNVAEAAMIAGLFQAPSTYDPYKNPEATEARRQTVLKLMLRHNYITQEEYEIAKEMTVEKIVIPQEESNYSSSEVSEYQSFIDTVVSEVKEKTGNNPYTTPMVIYSTMNTEFQDYINDIMSGENYDWENDVVQAGVAVLDVNDGSIVAIGGGRNVNAIGTYNFATDIKNQIGSTAKPLYDYGPAIEYNKWSPSRLVVDEPSSYSDGITVNNWDGGFQGLQTLRTALNGSRNIPALKTFKANDKSKVIEFVTSLGLTPEIYSCDDGYTKDGNTCINDDDPDDVIDANQSTTLHEAHALGGYNGESPLTMAAAYSAFSNGGTYNEPHSFTKLEYETNGKEYINDYETHKAMSEETAYIITDMLTTTAPNAFYGYYNINGVKYAAKTGTTNFDDATMKAHNIPDGKVNDLWVIGYNTEYAIGLWYGYKSIKDGYYNNLNGLQHVRLFQAIGKKIFTNSNAWEKPSGVVSVAIEDGCIEDGCLPSEYTPSSLIKTELFVKGSEPTETSTRFSKLSDVSNLKATASNGEVTLTWTSVNTPEINTESYLREYYKKIFENSSYLNSYVSSRLSWNNSNLGTLGYNVYVKDSSGNLELLDFTSTNKYVATMDENGTYTFVVKTSYSIFKSNMADGKQVTATVTGVTQKEEKEETTTKKDQDKKS